MQIPRPAPSLADLPRDPPMTATGVMGTRAESPNTIRPALRRRNMKTGVTVKMKTCHFTPTPFTSCLLGLMRGEATSFTTVESLHCLHCLHFESFRMMNLSSALL